MADVSVDATVSTSTARGMRSVVFTTDLIGYLVYINSDGTIGWIKTTDGGATWGSTPTQFAFDTTIIAFDVWYDRWTPGDTGTLMHVWWFDSTGDRIRYVALNTSSDTPTPVRAAFLGASAVAGRGAFVSGCKTRSGYLYVAYDIDAGAEKGFHRSTDAGVNWSVTLSTTFVEATLDTCKLFPASGTGDDNDCWALYYDASALALTLKLWDSSAVAQVESATIGVAHTDGATDLTGQFGYDAAVRHSDGHLIAAALSARDVAASTHQVFDITSTSVITTKTAIAASTDDHYYPQVFIDQSTDAIYVAYNGQRDGSEVLDTTTKVYYTKSTDGGATWTAGDTAYMEGAAGVVQQVWTPLSGPRFYAVWRAGTTLVGNKVNSVSTPSGPAAQSVTGATLVSTSVVYSPQTVTPGAVTLTGATRATTVVLYEGTVAGAALDQAITGTTRTSTAVLQAGTVAAGAVTLSGATVASTAVIRTPQVVTPGAVTIAGATRATTAVLPAGSVTAGAVTVTGVHRATTLTIHAGTVTVGAVTVTGATRASTATLTAGQVTTVTAVTGATRASTVVLHGGTVTTTTSVSGAPRPSTAVLFGGAVLLEGGLAGAFVPSTASLYSGTVAVAASASVMGATLAAGGQVFPGTAATVVTATEELVLWLV